MRNGYDYPGGYGYPGDGSPGEAQRGEGWGDELGGVFRTNESYDPKSDRWVEETPMPTARHGFAKGVIDGKLYTVSGTSLMHMFSVVAVNEVYAP